MKPIKIIISGDNGPSLPSPFGGIMKHCLLCARDWKAAGAEVALHVYHRHDNEDDLGASADYFYDFESEPRAIDKLSFVFKNFLSKPGLFLSILHLEMSLLPEYDWGLMLFCAGRAVVLDAKVKTFLPDVILAETGGLQSLASLEVAKRNKLPVVLENYAEILFRGGADGNNSAPRYAKLWKYLVNNVDLVVSTSVHCAKGPETYITDPSKMRIIYSGINFDVFGNTEVSDKKALRAKFGLPQEKKLVMSVGSLKMRKGHDHLFESLLLLSPEERKNIFVVLCGMGDLEQLKSHAREIGFPDDSLKIFQKLPEADLAELYAAVDCFCFPSVTPRECMGLALKEAMSVGLPVAAYDSGGIKEAVEGGVNGILVPTGDKQALSRAIAKLLQLSDKEKEDMRLRNKEKARQLFDLRVTSKMLFDELEKISERA